LRISRSQISTSRFWGFFKSKHSFFTEQSKSGQYNPSIFYISHKTLRIFSNGIDLRKGDIVIKFENRDKRIGHHGRVIEELHKERALLMSPSASQPSTQVLAYKPRADEAAAIQAEAANHEKMRQSLKKKREREEAAANKIEVYKPNFEEIMAAPARESERRRPAQKVSEEHAYEQSIEERMATAARESERMKYIPAQWIQSKQKNVLEEHEQSIEEMMATVAAREEDARLILKRKKQAEEMEHDILRQAFADRMKRRKAEEMERSRQAEEMERSRQALTDSGISRQALADSGISRQALVDKMERSRQALVDSGISRQALAEKIKRSRQANDLEADRLRLIKTISESPPGGQSSFHDLRELRDERYSVKYITHPEDKTP